MIYFKLVLTMAFWGGAFVAGRYLALSMPHFLAATGRFLFASILLYLFVCRREGRLPQLSRDQMWVTFGLGASGVFAYNAFFFAGLGVVAASRASLIVAMSPVMTLIAARFLYRERWGRLRIVGVALSLLGVMTVVSRGDYAEILSGGVGVGELYIFAAMVAWVTYTLLGKVALSGLTSLGATTWASLWGCGLLAIPASWEFFSRPVAWPAVTEWLAMAYMGVFATAIAFVWYNEGVRVIGPTRTTQVTNLVPVFGVLLGVLVLDESLSASMLLGGALTVVGVVLANR